MNKCHLFFATGAFSQKNVEKSWKICEFLENREKHENYIKTYVLLKQ